MLPTPDYSHLKDFPNVYEPLEDTFLLIDALETDLAILKNLNPEIIVEIGSGSGVVINFLAKNLVLSNPLCIATDINADACLATRKCAVLNSNDIQVVNCEFVGPLKDRLANRVDILIFNPPYVITEKDELGSKSIPAAWAGGLNGREVMDKLFPMLDSLLSPNGIFYLVCIKPNNIDDIEKTLENLGFRMDIVLSRKAGIEYLFILRFKRK